MINPTWDMNINLKEFKKVLKNPRDKRFPAFFARVLSRVPFYEAFRDFITPRQFKKYYPKFSRQLKADLIGAGRIPFWEWLYKKLS